MYIRWAGTNECPLHMSVSRLSIFGRLIDHLPIVTGSCSCYYSYIVPLYPFSDGPNSGAAAVAAASRTAAEAAAATGSLSIAGSGNGLLGGDAGRGAGFRQDVYVNGAWHDVSQLEDGDSGPPSTLLDQIHDGDQVGVVCVDFHEVLLFFCFSPIVRSHRIQV